MTTIAEQIGPLAIMTGLLLCSGFFSASETAFFHLSGRHIASAGTKHHIDKLIAGLLKQPNRLLTSLLLANMLVNVAFFSMAGVLSIKIQRQYGSAAAMVCAAICFIVLLLAGEMLPKSIAYANTRKVSALAAAPIYVCMRLLAPALAVIDWVIVKPAVRLLAPPPAKNRQPKPVTVSQLKLLLESSQQKGLISSDQNQLLMGVIELGLLKVRNVMKPRVEMTACSIHDNPKNVRAVMLGAGLQKIPAYTSDIDSIAGLVYLKDLMLYPQTIEKLLRPARFVPEQKTVESLMQFFQNEKEDFAIAVDEYGGIAGSVCIDDVVGQILGPADNNLDPEPIKQLGPMKYRLSARLAIHDWVEGFELDPEQIRLTTLGGFVTALLGKIPKPGDTAKWQNMRFTVEGVKKNRIERLILTLEHTVRE